MENNTTNTHRNHNFITEMVLPVVLICGLVIGASMTISTFMDRRSCNTYQSVTGTKTMHVLYDACYVEMDGKFERIDVYRAKLSGSN